MRLIDADALNKKLCETTIFIKDGEKFQRMINDAPTIEPDGDLISRQDAILAITGEPPEAHYPSWYADRIKSLPSAPDSRQRGEWVRKYDGHINCYWYECDQCGEYRPRNQFGHEYNANFCPNCGARMYKGGEDE